MDKIRQRPVLWLTRTAVFIALLITFQWSTAGTQVFAGQYITGALVNCVLAVAALYGGFWSGLIVALLSPFCAFLLGIGPKLLQIVPCIALGNAAFTALLAWVIGKPVRSVWRQACGLAAAAGGKFILLWLGVTQVAIPAMGAALKPVQVQMFSTMFSWPQLVTALIGGTLALLVMPLLRKAMQ